MRRHLGGALAWGVVAAAIGLALYGRAAERAVRKVEEPVVLGAPEPRAESTSEPQANESRTLPVGESASEADGLLELRVTAAGRPVSRAQVRLYLRGGRIPETGRVDWRMAAAGATGNDGRLQMPAREGAYLVVARAEGLAPAWRELVHPLNGNLTPVHLRMEEPLSFSGRTVAQDTGQPVAGAELTLTPHVSAWEHEARADAPAEERVTVTSDATGFFQVEGLAPGLYTVEGHAPGIPFTEEWNLRVPTSAEPRVLALPTAHERSFPGAPRQPASPELRCGTR
ncbi:MAG TPA: carboxypeptidase-like regulatory domain-containing protein [Myxococcaceae bacterium]|jgi:hypothetical protein